MADYTADEVRQKIENAKQNGNDSDVPLLEAYLKDNYATDTDAGARESALAGGPDVDPLPPVEDSAASPALSDAPSRVAPGALNKTQNEKQLEKARADSVAQSAHDADQQIVQQQNQNMGEVDWEGRANFLKEHGMSAKHDQQEVIQDPNTGNWRWSALSPAQMTAIEGDPKGLGSVVAAVPGLLTATVVDQIGNRVQRLDEEQALLPAMQATMWEEMTNAERTRFREEFARRRTAAGEGRQHKASDITDQFATGSVIPQMFKEILDQNPEARDDLFKRIAGDEQAVAWSERWKRLGSMFVDRSLYGRIPGSNKLGAEDPEGDILGFGQYEGLEDKYARSDKDAPAFPGASNALDEWLSTAENEGATTGQVYRKLIAEPFEAFANQISGTDKKFGELIHAGAKRIREEALTDELVESRDKPLLPEGTEFDDLFDAETWNDPSTALPWHDPAAFAVLSIEQVPYLLESMLAARSGGKLGAGMAARSFAGRKLSEIEKYRKRYAMLGGGAAGGATEGAMIYDQVYSEAAQTINAIPFERLRQDKQFMGLVASGMSEEQARQMLAQDSARSAGKGAFVGSAILLGTPMGMLMGSSAAGSLIKRNTGARVGAALVGEPVQEAAQESIEGWASDIQIEQVDPNNPIFSEKGRGLARAFGGFALGFTNAPVAAIGALSPEAPVGYNKQDVAAARKTETYMDARNKRFEMEFSISDPEYIRTTDPMERLHAMNRLEKLQVKEADAIIAMEADVREHLAGSDNFSSSKDAELKMLNTLVMSANAMKTDIALARSRRKTAAEMVEEQQVILQERLKIQQNVAESVLKIEDIDRVASNIEKVQKFETVDENGLNELTKEGYTRTNEDGSVVVLPKGKRALKEMMRQRAVHEGRLETGYTGAERRNMDRLIDREVIDNAGPADRETMLYEDSLTGVQNRRAFNDRVENIDERDDSKRTASKAKAVAAVDIDNLKWVNDNLGEHAAGDTLLMAVADALQAQKDLTVYRVGGDEFVVTGESEELIEAAMQEAKDSLLNKPIKGAGESVTPQMTWATGPDYKTADKAAVAMKNDRHDRGLITREDGTPTTQKVDAQGGLFQRVDTKAADTADTVLQKARDGDPDAQATLKKFGLGWDGNLTKYRMVGKNEVAALMAGETISSSRDGHEGKRTDVTNNPDYAKVSADSDHRITFKQTDKFDSDLGGKDSLYTKNEKEGEYWLHGGYSLDDVQVIEVRQKDGTWKNVWSSTTETVVKVIAKGMLRPPDDGRFQLDAERGLPDTWYEAEPDIYRGDHVEILTPDGAVSGVITNKSNNRGRPRLKVDVQGRRFTFNPEGNWLIVTPETSRADIAWITGDAEFAKPGQGSMPQTIAYVNIGHIGKFGTHYADLGPKEAPVRPTQDDWLPENIWDGGTGYADHKYGGYGYGGYGKYGSSRYKFVKPKLKQASKEQVTAAMAMLDLITAGNSNLPNISMITDLEKRAGLDVNGNKIELPDTVVEQINAEGASITSARGYFDHITPENGLFIFVTNIGSGHGDYFQQSIAETILHELIGHYGVRGLFGSERALRIHMHSLVDAFPKLAKHFESKLSFNRKLSLLNGADKQLIGEEMVAYLAGEVLSGSVVMNEKQKSVWQRFLAFIRGVLTKRNFNRFSLVQKVVTKIDQGMTIQHTKEMFWNDQRVQELVNRSAAFVRNGKSMGFEAIPTDVIQEYNQRDTEIFTPGIIAAINHATKKPSSNEKNQLVQQGKYATKADVPNELPLFPDEGSPNLYRQAIIAAGPGDKKLNLFTGRELHLSHLDDKRDWSFLRDATYNDLKNIFTSSRISGGGTLDQYWYKDIMPANLVKEMDDANMAISNAHMVGPLGAVNNEVNRPEVNKVTIDLARERIREITDQKINQKKTRLTKELLNGYIESSSKVFRVSVRRNDGFPHLDFDQAKFMLFGADQSSNDLTDQQLKMIKDEQEASRMRGPDIGYNEETNRWQDWARGSTTYSNYVPAGHKQDRDYRIVLITTSGDEGEMYTGGGGHFDGNLFHVRTGIADYLDIGDGFEIPDAPNPANNNKFLTMIELQSDWLQAARKSYATVDERSGASAKRSANIGALDNAVKRFSDEITLNLWERMDDVFKPLANLPSGSLKNELEEYVIKQDLDPWENLSEEAQNSALKTFRQEAISKVLTDMNTAIAGIANYIGDETLTHGLAGSMDARMFGRLDKKSVKIFAGIVKYSLEQAVSQMYNIVSAGNDNAEFIKEVGTFKADFMRYLKEATNNERVNSSHRLPKSGEQLDEMLGPVYDLLGADRNGLTDAISNMQVISSATVRMSNEPLIDAITAMSIPASNSSPEDIVRTMFAPTRIVEAGLPMDSVSVSVNTSTDGYVDIDVSGTKAAINEFSDKIPEIIKSWIAGNAPARRIESLRDAQRRAGESIDLSSESYSTLEDELGIERIDPSSFDLDNDDRALLREWEVTTMESYEEADGGEVHDEIIDEALNNIDWDTTSFNRDHEEYRDQLVIDEDGDVDNTEAESWLASERETYMEDIREDDSLRDQAYEQLRERWDNDPPWFAKGYLPVRWNAEGGVEDTLELVMVNREVDGTSYVYIDGVEKNYFYSERSTQDELSDLIKAYYRDQNITPPPGKIFAPVNPPLPPEDQAETTEPNWDIVANNLVELTSVASGTDKKIGDIYDDMVRARKIHDQVIFGSPLDADKDWRTIGLKYLLADAVRRGLPGIVWGDGLSSKKRGGWSSVGEVVRPERITWQQEKMMVQGKEQVVIVINAPELQGDLWVAPDKMIPILGTKLSSFIYQQMQGKAPLMPVLEEPSKGTSKQLTMFGDDDEVNPDLGKHFLVSQVESSTYVVHRRSNHDFIGFARDKEQLRALLESNYEKLPAAKAANEAPIASELLGVDTLPSGEVTRDMLGTKMHIITGGLPQRFEHTYGQTDGASARESYEKITVSIWNNELKKYGVQIGRSTIQVDNPEHVELEEGAPIVRTNEREKRINETYGWVGIKEMTGENHGWVLMSERDGPLMNRAFSRRGDAEDQMAEWKLNNFGNEQGGVEVSYIPITSEIIEAFSGPVAPFHYDPNEDPKRKEIYKRFGAELPKQSFSERWQKLRYDVKANWQQGLFDSFYGIKAAMRNAGISASAMNDPYIQARLSTSMDSMMKGALLYGHPVWKEGIVQNEGKGLAEIFRPIMKDTKPWEAFMYGRRGKRLMQEGYDKLTMEDRVLIDNAARHFGGDRFAAMLWARMRAARTSVNGPTLSRRDVLKAIMAAPVAVSAAGKIVGTATAVPVNIKELKAAMLRIMKGGSDPGVTPMGEQPRIIQLAKTLAKGKKGKLKKNGLFGKIRTMLERSDLSTADMLDLMEKVEVDILNEAGKAVASTVKKEVTATPKKKSKGWAKGDDAADAAESFERMIAAGREHRFSPEELDSMVSIADEYPHFHQVAKDWAVYNKAVLDFAQEAGTINKETRPVWEHSDYVPFHTIGREEYGALAGGNGIANVKSPLQRLMGSTDGDLDIVHNILTKTTTLMEGAVKNHAALMAVDMLKGTGIISKAPLKIDTAIVPLSEVEKHLRESGMDIKNVPSEVIQGVRKMRSIGKPDGPGVLSIMRNGKREYYETTDPILFRAMTAINKKVWDNPVMTALRGGKRYFTQFVTADPAFQAANFVRDTGSAFVLSRDPMIPVASAIKGLAQALTKDEAYRTLLGAGAAFENGYITAGDPKRTKKILKRAMRSTGFMSTVLDTPRKLWDAYFAIGSAIENANRVGVYNAAIAAGKPKAQGVFEAKDLMDFTMSGDWDAVQLAIQTVPFMGARIQGLHRLGRGFAENPAAFTLKATLLTAMALSIWFKFHEDERYKELEEWDKDTYIHWWVGDAHYRLPKPFELGAIFMTVPERIAEMMYSEESDDGKLLLNRLGHMFSETFAMNPVPQAIMPMTEMATNHNFFAGRDIVSFYEGKRQPPEQRRYYTSPTMVQLSKAMPKELDTVGLGKLRSPLHLQKFFSGYTAAIGKYVLMATDWAVVRALELPLPPARDISDYAVVSRFYRGEGRFRRTKYEQEVYELLDKTTAIQGSLGFLEREGNMDEYDKKFDEFEPYIVVSKALEDIRENVQDISRTQMNIAMDLDLTPADKDTQTQELQQLKNELFKAAWQLRPGGKENPLGVPASKENITDLMENFGVDDSEAHKARLREEAPNTHDLLNMVREDMDARALRSIVKATTHNVEDN